MKKTKNEMICNVYIVKFVIQECLQILCKSSNSSVSFSVFFNQNEAKLTKRNMIQYYNIIIEDSYINWHSIYGYTIITFYS